MTDKLREQSIEFAKKHLFDCAKEILDWGRTSILCDGKLRELAKTCESWVRDESYALGVAEAIVKEEALRAALAQQDAQAVPQEPVARLMKYVGKGTYPKKGYTVARTYEECPKDAYPNDWEEGPELHTHPSPTPPAQQGYTAADMADQAASQFRAGHDAAQSEIAELEQENRLLRARNDRLQKEIEQKGER